MVDRIEQVGEALRKAVDLQMNHGKTTILEILCTRELGTPFAAMPCPVRCATWRSTRDYT